MPTFSSNPESIANYRVQTKNSGPVASTTSQHCAKCGKIKPTSTGRRKALLPGPVTRHNPLRFTCGDCLTKAALQLPEAASEAPGADIAAPVPEANGGPAKYRDGAS